MKTEPMSQLSGRGVPGMFLFFCLTAGNFSVQGTGTDLPTVKEAMVFKDGHALVRHEGRVAVEPNGQVHLRHDLEPVMGTFWPYVAAAEITLQSVTSTRQTVETKRAPADLEEWILANPGKEVRLTESGRTYHGTLLPSAGIGDQTEENESSPTYRLEMFDGVRIGLTDRVTDLTFKSEPNTHWTHRRKENRLALNLSWAEDNPAQEVQVGLMYIQNGLRWIPHYRIDLKPDNTAEVHLQATLINELVDLEEVRLNLVVGVPQFLFEGRIDPIAIGKWAAQAAGRSRSTAEMENALSNAIMSQMVVPPRAQSGSSQRLNPAGDLSPQQQVEDLHIFTLDNITLDKGNRMVCSLGTFSLEYQDVYKLNIPIAPPMNLVQQLPNRQLSNLARQMKQPKVRHVLRLFNRTEQPLTTGPALIMREGRVVAQNLIKYTGAGSNTDLPLTISVDITAEHHDQVTQRTPDAIEFDRRSYQRIDLDGSITLSSHKDQEVHLEVTRWISGALNEVGRQGSREELNPLEAGGAESEILSESFGWNQWPNWWLSFNGIGKAYWEVNLESHESLELPYQWHYFWR